MTNWRARSGGWNSWWRRSSAHGDSDVTPPEEPDDPAANSVDDALNGHDGPRTESFAVVGAARTPRFGHEAVRLAYATRQEIDPGAGDPTSYTAVRVRVANLGYQKDVRLRWRADDGWSESPLEWKATFGDHDVFASQVPATAEFAVRYRVDDAEYWDNNGGGNYRLDSPGNSLVGGGIVQQGSEQVHVVAMPDTRKRLDDDGAARPRAAAKQGPQMRAAACRRDSPERLEGRALEVLYCGEARDQ